MHRHTASWNIFQSMCKIFLTSLYNMYFVFLRWNVKCFSWTDTSVCIGVLHHLKRYFSYICDGTDVQADWRRSCTQSGAQRHRHFVGFFDVPVQAPTRGQPFNGYSEKPPHFSRLLRRAWGYEGYILILNPEVSTGMFIQADWISCGFRGGAQVPVFRPKFTMYIIFKEREWIILPHIC